MNVESGPPRRRPGGRSARVERAVLDATTALLIHTGYDQMTLEKVAIRAGVNKTTVYRRWGSKPSLVAQACLAAASRDISVPDHGNLRDDLRAMLTEVADLLERDAEGTLARVVVGGAAHTPELREALQSFWQHRVAPATAIVERAVQRGELPACTDAELLIETAAAPVWMRALITGLPLDEDFIEHVTQIVLNGSQA